MDAAIAANAVLGVTEPMMNGIGGDLFLLYWDAKTGKLYGLNASGWAPRGLSIEYLKQKGTLQMPQAGIDSVTVPGAVDGWAKGSCALWTAALERSFHSRDLLRRTWLPRSGIDS